MEASSMSQTTPATILHITNIFSSCVPHIVTYDNFIEIENDDVSKYAEQFSKKIVPVHLYTVKQNRLIQVSIVGRVPRFRQCRLQIFPQQFFTEILGKEIEALWWLRIYLHIFNVLPTYCLVFLSSDTLSSEFIRETVKRLNFAFVPAKFIFIVNGQFNLVCIHFAFSNNVDFFYNLNTDSLEAVDGKFVQLYQNLQGAPIDAVGIIVSESCARLLATPFIGPQYCIVTEAIRALNASSEFGRKGRQNDVISRAMGSISFQYALYLLTVRNGVRTFRWLTAGEIISKIKFVNVVEIQPQGLVALLDAFDIFTWLNIIAVSMLTAAGMAVIKSFTVKSRWIHEIGESSAFILAILIDQCCQIRLVKKYWKLGLLMFAWSQVALLFSSSYQGHLVSTLATVPTPKVPLNMEELVNSKTVFIASTANVLLNNYLASYFHEEIGDMLENPDFTHEKLLRTIKCLRDQLVFLNMTVKATICSQVVPGFVPDLKESENLKSIMKLQKSKHHVFIGEELDVVAYEAVLNNFMDDKVFVESEYMSLFTRRVPIVVLENYLASVISRKVSQLFSSGLWNLWEDLTVAAVVSENFNETWKALNRSRISDSSIAGIRMRVLNGDMLQTHRNAEELKSPSLGYATVIFELLFLGLGGAFCSFTFEYLKRLFILVISQGSRLVEAFKYTMLELVKRSI